MTRDDQLSKNLLMLHLNYIIHLFIVSYIDQIHSSHFIYILFSLKTYFNLTKIKMSFLNYRIIKLYILKYNIENIFSIKKIK